MGAVIAVGGMSTIHRAFDRLAQREVAYKRLRVSTESNRARLTAMLRREYDTLARLDHPNVVVVYEFGVDAEGPFYAMELVDGDDLTKSAPMAWSSACSVLRDVASALSLVHARRLVHRDVSPNNVRLTTHGKTKLIDFGALTAFGVARNLVGTPPFIAPECLSAEPLDQRADLYALGALAYWLLTRKLAVSARTLEELPAGYTQPIVPPSTLVADIPHELDDLILALLRPERAARPASASAVAERLINIAGLSAEPNERKVAQSYLKHPPLQGRESVLAAFDQSLQAVMEGRGSVMIVEGAPGAGRTAVLDDLSLRAQLRGATVLRAEGRVHRKPLAAATHLGQMGSTIFPTQTDRHAPQPSMVALPVTSSATDVVEAQTKLAASMQDVLLRVSVATPLVLLVDDAHLVDAQSLALLASMSETLRTHAISLVVSRPSVTATSDADAVLRAAATQHATLTPLTEPEVIALIATMFGDVPNSLRLARWLFAESGGNPGHCMNLASSLLQRGVIQYTRVSFILSAEFEHALSAESAGALTTALLSDLDDDATAVCELLSLSRTAATVSQLAALSGLSTPRVLDALGDLSRRSLLSESAGSYALASRGLATSVVAALPPDRRRARHIALARMALASTPLGLDERLDAGSHLIHAGGSDELEGADVISQVALDSSYEIGISASRLVPVEHALAVYEKHGYSDLECAHLLKTLTVGGFYGNLTLQRRYFDRTMQAISTLTGMKLAARLERWLGARLSLVVGIIVTLIAGAVRRTRTPKQSLTAHFSSLVNVTTAAVAAAGCALDAPEAERIVAWLDPLAPMPPNNPLQIGRQFCLAAVETAAGKLSAPIARFEALLEILSKPVRNLDEHARTQLIRGCHHGIAECTMEDDPKRSLDEADELEKTPFFAPHAEMIRMFYAGFRGDRARAEQLRASAEARALLGGVSWSALVLLNARAYGLSLMTFDLLELSRTCAEFERVQTLSPGLFAEYQLAKADLLRLRGKPAESLPIYRAVLEAEAAPKLTNYRFACAWYARALVESGDAEAAKAFCEARLSDPDENPDRPLASYRPLIAQQLAYAEATLGNVARAASILDAQLAQFRDTENPLLLGTLQRERAHVALLAEDAVAFDQSYLAMKAWFDTTSNPWLMQQCDALAARAIRSGMHSGVSQRTLAALEASSTTMDGATIVGTKTAMGGS